MNFSDGKNEKEAQSIKWFLTEDVRKLIIEYINSKVVETQLVLWEAKGYFDKREQRSITCFYFNPDLPHL